MENSVNKFPYFGFQWHITDLCDQRCKHCYVHKDSNKKQIDEMTFSQMCETIDYCINFCERFSFRPWFFITGGDPLLNRDFWKLVQKLKECDFPFTIMGNPYHLTEDVCQRLYDFGCRQYQLSIDGLRHTHDFIRREGSFDETLQKIPLLLKTGIATSVMTTVSNMNIQEIPEIMEIVAEHNVHGYSFTRFCAVDSNDNINISPEQYRHLFDLYSKKAFELRKRGYKTLFGKKDHLWSLHEYELLGKDFPNVLDVVSKNGGCGCGKRHLTILPDGQIWACRRMYGSKVGIISDNDYEDMWLVRMEHYRQYDKFEKCSKCELLTVCRGCPAVSYSSSGDFYAADQQCWKQQGT